MLPQIWNLGKIPDYKNVANSDMKTSTSGS